MAGGEGTLCLGGVLGRFNNMISPIDVDGTVEFTLDPQQIPAGGVLYSAFVGDFYQFQVWHRDFVGFQTSNYTNAVTILWD